MGIVRVTVVTGFGINADRELALAFDLVGAVSTRVHLIDLIAEPKILERTAILALPGGFSFGDHLGSGLVFAARFRHHLSSHIDRFLERGGLAIGICNGFQVMAKGGMVPNLDGHGYPEVTLVHNDTGRFVDSWVKIAFDNESPCIWTRNLAPMEIPIRHGEGRFVARSDEILDRVESEHLVAVRYVGENPNGSARMIAGITEKHGRVLGLMPHPEAFISDQHHPRWTRKELRSGNGLGNGLELLRNGVIEASGG